ncbi:MAG TPA: proline/glycine betaine ABC transporter permease [Nitrospiraceae bacterium]|jgi:glycine betaine/proline transport system permease protein
MLKYRKPILWSLLGCMFIALVGYSYSVSTQTKPGSLGELLSDRTWLNNWPRWLDMPLQSWTNGALDWLVQTYGWVFDAVNAFLLGVLVSLLNALTYLPWPVVILLVVALTYVLSGRKWGTTILVGTCLFFIGFLSPKFWDKAMQTTGVMLIAILLCMVIGMPVAIAMSRSDRLRHAILPILDLMQTIPSFCYLIPGIMLFGLGAVPAIIATFIYAVPPLIRLTDLGIRLVDQEIIEAAESFGASPRQKLFIVQIPLALPNIMQGINQCTMMALALVVIASMIGTRGLGDEVLLGLQQLNPGRALEAGIAIVLLAIVLDRITQAYGDTLQERKVKAQK